MSSQALKRVTIDIVSDTVRRRTLSHLKLPFVSSLRTTHIAFVPSDLTMVLCWETAARKSHQAVSQQAKWSTNAVPSSLASLPAQPQFLLRTQEQGRHDVTTIPHHCVCLIINISFPVRVLA